MSKNILITGGTGLLGTHLTTLLRKKGYTISYLSRRKQTLADIQVYEWDIAKGTIETEAITNADYIIHLAGAGVADKLWSVAYKKEIYDSRVLSTKLLVEKLTTVPNKCRAFIQASAIGYYGLDTQERWIDEKAPAGIDFLAQVTHDWEQAASPIAGSNIRHALLRIGVVLCEEGGALPKLSLPVKMFLGAAIGAGTQYISWIHIEDLCEMFVKAIENEAWQGVYNASAPNPVTNEEMTKVIGKVLSRPVFLPNVPAFVLRMGMGEMANIVLGGNRTSCQKVEKAGFKFVYPQIEAALRSLL
jgi:uncharacterized protein (TIGR01777 family)